MPSRRVVWTLGFLFLALVLVACGHRVPATESAPRLAAKEQVSTPTPLVQPPLMPMSTPVAGQSAATPQVPAEKTVTSQLPTANPPDPAFRARMTSLVVPPATALAPQALPDVFLIYPLLSHDLATPASGRRPEAYQQDVIEAVTTDLARRLGKPADSVHFVDSGYLEIQLASPCGGRPAKGSADPAAGGRSLGFEVLLEVESTGHRYIGVGGLAHYCGLQ